MVYNYFDKMITSAYAGCVGRTGKEGYTKMGNGSLQELEITQGTVVSLAVTAAVLFALPIIYVAFWKKRCGKNVSFAPLIIGAAGFLVTVRVLELGVHMICIVLDNPISRFINGSTPAFVLYGILMAGIFEECGRYVIIKFLMKKNKTKENMVMYGIGHGGIEVWAITLLTVINFLVIAVILRTQGTENGLQLLGITGDAPESVINSVTAVTAMVADFGAVTGALYVFERFCCMFLHIGFTILVAYGIAKGQKKYLLYAILAHAITDTLPALSQRGVVNMWVVELWVLACAAVLTVWGVKLYQKWAE